MDPRGLGHPQRAHGHVVEPAFPPAECVFDRDRREVVEDLDLPPLRWDDLRPILRLLASTYAVDVRGVDARVAADSFFPFVVSVYDTLANPSDGPWSAATGARIAPVLAHALFRYAEQTHQSQLLEDAATLYRDVLATYARWRQPLDWARAESHLGGALAQLGEWASDPVRLEQAVDTFRAALWERTSERAPLERALTQMKLGTALTTLAGLGAQSSTASRLEEAATAYRAALTDEMRAHMPLAWASAQNNLGNVFKALGDLKVDVTRWEEAAIAYRAALTVETRHHLPLHWATVQSKLAAALTRLGEARSDASQLKEAEPQLTPAPDGKPLAPPYRVPNHGAREVPPGSPTTRSPQPGMRGRLTSPSRFEYYPPKIQLASTQQS